MFPLFCVGFWPVKPTGNLGRNQTIFNTGKTPVSSPRARDILGQEGRKDQVLMQCSTAAIDFGGDFAAGHVVLLAQDARRHIGGTCAYGGELE